MIVDELKKSILNSAFRGNLIKNNDELLAQKNFISIDEKMNIPSNWKCVKIGEVIDIVRGASPRPIKAFITNDVDGINWIKIGDTDKNSKFITSSKEKITKEGAEKSRYVKKGQFLLSNSMSFGKPYILDIDGCVHDGWLILNDKHNFFSKDYLYYLLSSDLIYRQFCDKASGAVVNNLNINKVKETIIPLPPIEEQHRIVYKIDELFAHLNETKILEEKLEKIKSDFPKKFKDSILQYAISGKLTNQREAENSKDILNFIEKENNKKLSSINNVPFEIPTNWNWIKFGELVSFNIGKTPSRADSSFWGGDKYHWISISDMNENKIITSTKEYVSEKSFNELFKGKISKKGTLIMSFKLTVGRCSILGIDSFHNEGIISIYPNYNNEILKQYLFKILPYVTKYGDTKGAIKGNTLNSESLSNLIIPLPPIDEQKRIIEKLDKLFNFYDDIKKIFN